MSESHIHRVTLFKVKDEDRKSVIAAYEVLKRDAIKVLLPKPSLMYSQIQDLRYMVGWQELYPVHGPRGGASRSTKSRLYGRGKARICE